VLAAFAVIGVVELTKPRDFYTGTNSVATRGIAAGIPDGGRLCATNVQVPAGTGRIELSFLGTEGRPPMDAILQLGGRRVRSSVPADFGALVFPIPRTADTPAVQSGRLCVIPRGDGAAFGGTIGLQGNDEPLRFNGAPLEARLAIWYRPPEGEQRSLLSQLPEIAQRAALFRAGWVGPWTYWVLVGLLTPLLGYLALRRLARASLGLPRRVPAAVVVGLIAFANAATFATLSPSFQAPDESEHSAYAQILGETGHRPTLVPGRGAYSSEQNLALEGTRALSTNENFTGRPPWLERYEDEWRERVADAEPVGKADGGGPTTPAQHRPGYYAVAAAGYLAGSGGSFFDELWGMRIGSALLGAITAAFAFLFVRELLPRAPRRVALAAGLLVAFLPQFTFLAGAVNNDNGVGALAAVTLWLAARTLRRGLDWRWAAALGVAAALLPLFKTTGASLYPAIAVALLGGLIRGRDRRAVLGLVGAAGGLAAGAALLVLVDQIVTPVPTVQPLGGAGPSASAGGVVSRVLDAPTLYASYFWQTFLPPLPFMTDLWATSNWPFYDIYIRTGFASFGWYAMEFASWAYRVITLVVALTVAGALVALWRRRAAALRRWPELALVVLAIAGVLGGVAGAYFQAAPRVGQPPEQGRYAFVALAAFAAVAAAALLGLPRRWQALGAGALVAAMFGLQWASQLMLLQRFYT
jgi:4-amino-4-deoxy-L-arabinose transferase-like glycosyltransferase